MMPRSCRSWLPFALAVLPACSIAKNWQDLKTGPMTYAEVYDTVAFIADGDGFVPDHSACDRGLGTWQSRWRQRHLTLGRPQRYRLRVEIDVDEGSAAAGWPVRYVVEQQIVKDLRHDRDPKESDWSLDGQDTEREQRFGDRLARRLQPPSAARQPGR